MVEVFVGIAVVFITLASIASLLTDDWRASLGLLAVQYAGASILISLEWSPALSISVLAAGWFGASILGMAMLSLPIESREQHRPRINPLFNLLASSLILLLALSFTPLTLGWFPALNREQSWSAWILMGLGLLRLAFDPYPISISAALLSILLGFELLFAALSAAYLAVWLLAGVTLGIALAGAYLVVAPHIQETP